MDLSASVEEDVPRRGHSVTHPLDQDSFLEITREERFFCTLLAHGLLSSTTLRRGFYQLLHRASGVQMNPDADSTEIYTEVAWLRDYWRALGDPQEWSQQLMQSRIAFLDRCLGTLRRSFAGVESKSFIRTSGKNPKIVSPGRWPLAELGEDPPLERLKWAFNAKPDFIFVCEDRAVLLEVKVESPPGKKARYVQDEVQETLCRLLPAASPRLSTVGRAWLAPRPVDSAAETIRWSEVAGLVAQLPEEELDEFSRRGLARFAQRAAVEPSEESAP